MSGRVKELTVFCEQGDSAKIKTWSNVPYFLTTTLEGQGVKVNRVNLHPKSSFFHQLLYKCWNVFAKGVFHQSSYRRSALYYRISDWKIQKAVRKFANSDAFLFTSFSFSTKPFAEKPMVQFCDWTLEYDTTVFHGISPASLSADEQKLMERQRRCIEESDLVVSLFPGVASHMTKVYRNPEICYIGNVVNSLVEPDRSEAIRQKEAGKAILFVGKKHYRQGAEQLLVAFRRLQEKMPDAELHIIGMTADQLRNVPDGVICHGYLDKGKREDCYIYYDLMSKCRLFINTTPKWGAFSASVEAMYHYMPVIVSPYSEFVNTFGECIEFGRYHQEQDGADGLCWQMVELLADDDFDSLAEAAHQAVAEMTWSHFTNRILNRIDKIVERNGK